jgi:pimeloyl-ACP methyl ester carboxylesterase
MHRDNSVLNYCSQVFSKLLLGHKLRWMILFLILFASFLFYEYKKWVLNVPKPLPQYSVIVNGKTNAYLDENYYEASIPPTGSAQYISAGYRLWIPKNIKALRGIIVKQHGCGGDPSTALGLIHANDLQWQALALKHRFALLGTKYPTDYATKNRYPDDPCNSWGLIDRGSEKAFLMALRKLAQDSRHPELVKVPWALWGHSGGADWSIQMAQKYPERTIAVVLARGGAALVSDSKSSLILNSKLSSGLLRLPVLFALGEKDPHIEEAIEIPKKVFNRYRRAGAPWAIAIEADAGHETAETRLLAIPFLDAAMSARRIASDGKLQPMNAPGGWLGNLTTHAISPIEAYKGTLLDAAWLPNEEIARKWQAYETTPSLWEQLRSRLCSRKRIGTLLGVPYLIDSCRTHKITPTRKPSAPTDVSAIKTGEAERILTWKFTPDIENGLPSFRIYRNNSLIATLQGQNYDGGDMPMPPNIVMEFQDKRATANSTYAVSAFNMLGESISQAYHSTKLK